MIIRILGEGQYKIDDKHLDELNKIDNRIVDHVNKGDKVEYKKDLEKLTTSVKQLGMPLDSAEIVQSDFIFPPEDLSFEEAKNIFNGTGLIKD
jgi:hypothetical protein